MSGSWTDVSFRFEAAGEALSRLPESRHVIVENGGHNIYEADPRMIDIVRAWLADGTAPETLVLAPPQFDVRP